MNKNLVIFAFGVLVGIVCMKVGSIFPPQSLPVVKTLETTSAPTPDTTSKTISIEKTVEKGLVPHQTFNPLNINSNDSVAGSPRSSATPIAKIKKLHTTTTLRLFISEAVVSELEANEEQLKNLIYAEPNENGWLIHVKENDNLLTRLGIQDGDQINYDSLNSETMDKERAQLADRMKQFLNKVHR